MVISLGSSVGFAADRLVEPVEGMHRAIAKPWFAVLGPIGRPVRFAHDVVSSVVYGSIRVGAAVLGAGLDARTADDSAAEAHAQAIVNGLWGDDLGRRAPRLRTSMGIRDRQGTAVPASPGLSAAFPGATGRIVVLVHGLIETERCWHGSAATPGLYESLAANATLTPIMIRYNTGLPVAVNGARLVSLLDEIHAGWPAPIRSIALVGHSMGGLVIRSAYATADPNEHGWICDVTDVVTIGSPHRGTPLEKLVSAAAFGLTVAPQTRPLADFLDRRSQGVKDLRHGNIGSAADSGTIGGRDSPAVRHHFAAGVITADPAHPFGAIVGDLIVRPSSSATAPQLEPTNVAVHGGVHHFDLLHEPAVIDRVTQWLDPAE